MKSFVVFSIVCVQFLTSHGAPDSVGVGSYIYSDSNGHRYGGAYQSKDGKVTSFKDFSKPGGVEPNKGGSELNGYNSRPDVFNNGQGYANAGQNLMSFPFNFVNSYVPTFNPGLNPGLNTFSDRVAPQAAAMASAGSYNPPAAYNNIFSNFFPTYFNNLQRNLQQAFQSNIENQRLAFEAARRAYDEPLPPLPSIFDDDGLNADGSNSAYALAALGGGMRQQVAAISPEESDNPNIAVVAPAQAGSSGPGYSMVASNSFVSSSNIGGREVTHKGATTIVDDNGKVTRYEVSN